MNAQPLLTHEDDLRLQILLAEGVLAVRIDVPRQTLVALTDRGDGPGEATLKLHPQGRPDSYWRQVREVLSGHALNSPGGYPVYLERWTRMGQASARSLDALLCLGEPEAVMAVAHAPSLTPEQARRAWWALPGSETARAMLAHAAIREDAIGVVLAQHLLEFLPFESDAVLALHSARAILSARLLPADGQQSLWRTACAKPHLLVAFIEQAPQHLPVLLGRPQDQALIEVALQVLERPGIPEAITLLQAQLDRQLGQGCWSGIDLLAPLGHARVVGTLLRRKLAPTLEPLIAELQSRQRASGGSNPFS